MFWNLRNILEPQNDIATMIATTSLKQLEKERLASEVKKKVIECVEDVVNNSKYRRLYEYGITMHYSKYEDDLREYLDAIDFVKLSNKIFETFGIRIAFSHIHARFHFVSTASIVAMVQNALII